MTTTAPTPTASAAISTSTRREDTITLALIAWLIAGLFIDGYAHANIIDTDTEDFFTPWHGIFYAAFVSLVAWIFVVGRRRQSTAPVLDWFPAGYRVSVIGIAVFALGGIGDGIWHTVFGVEVGIDALLSPTHLVLFTGGLLLLWTPVRAAAARGDTSPWLAIGAVALTTSFLVFFVEYMFTISQTWIVGIDFDPRTQFGWEYVTLYLASVVVQIGVLLGPLLLIARRWHLPFGTATLTWTIAATLEYAAFDGETTGIVAVLVGGLVFDATRIVVRHPRRLSVAAFVGPAAVIATHLALAAADVGMGWPPEIWGGAVIMAGFTGIGLATVQESGRATPVTASI